MPLLVKDIMTKKVETIGQNASAQSASKIMARTGKGSLIVLKGKKPVGILTDSDLIERVLAKNRLASKIRIKEIMSAPLIVTTPEETCVEAARKMRRYDIKRLPVVKRGKLVGIVSNTDIALTTPEFMNILEERLAMKVSGEEPVRTTGTLAGICEVCGNYAETLEHINGQWVCEDCKEGLKEG